MSWSRWACLLTFNVHVCLKAYLQCYLRHLCWLLLYFEPQFTNDLHIAIWFRIFTFKIKLVCFKQKVIKLSLLIGFCTKVEGYSTRCLNKTSRALLAVTIKPLPFFLQFFHHLESLSNLLQKHTMFPTTPWYVAALPWGVKSINLL